MDVWIDNKVQVLFAPTETLKGNTNGLWENESVRKGDGGPSPNSLQPSFLAFRQGSNWRLFSWGQSNYTQSFNTKLDWLCINVHLIMEWWLKQNDFLKCMQSMQIDTFYYINLSTETNQFKQHWQCYQKKMLKVLKFLMRAPSKGWNSKSVWTVSKKFLLALIRLSNQIYTWTQRSVTSSCITIDLYHFMT